MLFHKYYWKLWIYCISIAEQKYQLLLWWKKYLSYFMQALLHTWISLSLTIFTPSSKGKFSQHHPEILHVYTSWCTHMDQIKDQVKIYNKPISCCFIHYYHSFVFLPDWDILWDSLLHSHNLTKYYIKENHTNLKTSHISTEKRSKFASTALTLALITHLVIQHIWLNLHLW
jgi:hypothetical protein